MYKNNFLSFLSDQASNVFPEGKTPSKNPKRKAGSTVPYGRTPPSKASPEFARYLNNTKSPVRKATEEVSRGRDVSLPGKAPADHTKGSRAVPAGSSLFTTAREKAMKKRCSSRTTRYQRLRAHPHEYSRRSDKKQAHPEPSAVETRSNPHPPKPPEAVPYLFPEHGTS